LEVQLHQHLWVGLIIWVALFIGDYAFTITCARLYRRGVNEKIAFEGSFELTPLYQKDIDSLKTFSPRFLLVIVLVVALLSASWYMDSLVEIPAFYLIVLGNFLGLQFAIHMRHLRNFFLFRAILNSDMVRGRIEYRRPLILSQSSLELFTFAILFAILALFTGSWLILGGTLGCLSTAFKHWQLSRKAMKSAAPELEPELVNR